MTSLLPLVQGAYYTAPTTIATTFNPAYFSNSIDTFENGSQTGSAGGGGPPAPAGNGVFTQLLVTGNSNIQGNATFNNIFAGTQSISTSTANLGQTTIYGTLTSNATSGTGQLVVNSTTDATSSTSAAAIIKGGLAVASKAYFGGDVSCGTSALTAGAIIGSGAFTCGTNALTAGAITGSGAFTCGTNALTCGAVVASSHPTATGSAMFTVPSGSSTAQVVRTNTGAPADPSLGWAAVIDYNVSTNAATGTTYTKSLGGKLANSFVNGWAAIDCLNNSVFGSNTAASSSTLYVDNTGLIVNALGTINGAFSCGTNALTAGAITGSGALSCGTNALTAGAITGSGAFTCGTNALTAGVITGSGAFTCGTNALTAGAITGSANLYLNSGSGTIIIADGNAAARFEPQYIGSGTFPDHFYISNNYSFVNSATDSASYGTVAMDLRSEQGSTPGQLDVYTGNTGVAPSKVASFLTSGLSLTGTAGTGQLVVNSTTDATSSTSAAAIIKGGLAVASKAYFGGDVSCNSIIPLKGEYYSCYYNIYYGTYLPQYPTTTWTVIQVYPGTQTGTYTVKSIDPSGILSLNPAGNSQFVFQKSGTYLIDCIINWGPTASGSTFVTTLKNNGNFIADNQESWISNCVNSTSCSIPFKTLLTGNSSDNFEIWVWQSGASTTVILSLTVEVKFLST
jgi:hypothetical protein